VREEPAKQIRPRWSGGLEQECSILQIQMGRIQLNC